MTVLSQTDRLRQALDRFQLDLDAKLAGEGQEKVRDWLKRLRASFDSLENILSEQWRHVHDRLFAKIESRGVGDLDNIRELRESDAKVQQLMEMVKAQLIVLEVESATSVEARVEQEPFGEIAIVEIVDRGSELVHWIREQESEVSMWYVESFSDLI